MIIWKFKGIDVNFRSTPGTHQRDIFKMAKSCGVPPETEIIYEHGNPNQPTVADTFAVDSNTTSEEQPTVPKATKTRKPRRKKTTGLSHVSGDVAGSDTSSDSLGDRTGDDIISSSSNGLGS